MSKRTLTEEQLAKAKCKASPTGAHWWLLSLPGEHTVKGTCKYCGEHREFPSNLTWVYKDNYKPVQTDKSWIVAPGLADHRW